MKELVASEPVIAQPLPTGVFHIEVDALGFALGGVLSQHHPDGKWHPVTFISRVMYWQGMMPGDCNTSLSYGK
jgi:hypothetical protein